MNIALYGRPHRWAMTERGRASLERDATHIAIGPSAMAWDGETLTITIDETNVPLPSRLRGTIVVRPRTLTTRQFDLHHTGRHRWRPIAPLSDVSVAFEAPNIAWQGTGYFDTNDGDEPLEAAFRSWTWSRFDMGDHARIFYDVVQKDGQTRALSLAVKDGVVVDAPAPAYQRLPSTGWRISRQAPCDMNRSPTVLDTLEDAPFYARSAIRSTIDGSVVTGMHESLSLRRVTSPIVRMMLPFKMPRMTIPAIGRDGQTK